MHFLWPKDPDPVLYFKKPLDPRKPVQPATAHIFYPSFFFFEKNILPFFISSPIIFFIYNIFLANN